MFHLKNKIISKIVIFAVIVMVILWLLPAGLISADTTDGGTTDGGTGGTVVETTAPSETTVTTETTEETTVETTSETTEETTVETTSETTEETTVETTSETTEETTVETTSETTEETTTETAALEVVLVPKVSTDKDDYSPGEIVKVKGSGWLPGETVKLEFVALPLQAVVNYYAVADSAGNISNSEYLIYDYHLDATIIFTATGQTSGLSAMTTFTDGAATTLTLSSSSYTCAYGGSLTLTATLLKASDSTPLDNKHIDFYLNGTNVGNNHTNPSGVATITVNPVTLDAGSYSNTGNYSTSGVGAKFSGTSGSGSLSASYSSASLTVTKLNTAITVSAVTGIYGGNVDLTATLSSGGLPLSGKTITFYLNGTSKGTATTDGSGVATRNVSLGTIAVGTYPGTYNTSGVGADFAGNTNYNSSNNANTLTVEPAGPKTSLQVTKTATGSSEGYIEWSIDKSVTPNTFNLSTGQTGTAHYTVIVTPTYHETGAVVSGTIHIQNDTGAAGEDKTASITYVKDKIEYRKSGSWYTLKTVDISGPFTISTGGSADVAYSVSFAPVSGATAYRNTALVGLANHPDGFHEFHYTVSFSISGGTITHDAYADVTDSLQGSLGQAWVGNTSTYTYTYDRQIGPYAVFGDYNVDNTATVTGTDTKKTDTDSARVTVHVTGLGSVTVYKNVKSASGSETSDDHHFNVKLYKWVGPHDHDWSYIDEQAFWEGNPAVFTGLEQGKQYKAVEDNDDDYDFVSNDGPKTLSGSNVDINIVNKQKLGSVTIKKDVQKADGSGVSDTHHFLVDLYMWVGPGVDDWQLIGQQTFYEGHNAYFDGLIKGRIYKAVEVDDPGYTLWSNDSPKTLACNVDINIVNRQKLGKIIVHKNVLDPNGNDLLLNDTSGSFQFKLDSGGSNQNIKDGDAIEIPNVSLGSHYIQEVTVPSGYTFENITSDPSGTPNLPNKKITFDVTSGCTINVYITNKQYSGKVIITKDVKDPNGDPVDDTTGSFGISLDGNSQGSLMDGESTSEITVFPGSHTVAETLPASGYDFVSIDGSSLNPYSFDVAAGQTKTILIINKQKPQQITSGPGPGTLKLVKTNSVTGSLVEGAEYWIYDINGAHYETLITGSDGSAVLSGFEMGPYTVKEFKEALGYMLDLTIYTVTFSPSNTNITLNVQDTPVSIVTVAALTEEAAEVVEVAGISETEGTIQVLAFTGMDPIIPISGGSAIAGGLAMLLATLRRRVIRK
jgi:hypothetical protein